MALLNSSKADSFCQSLVDSLNPICFTNWADELDGDESEDVAVIVVYNVVGARAGIADSRQAEQCQLRRRRVCPAGRAW